MKSIPHVGIKQKFDKLKDHLSERARRLWAGSEAKVLGYGGKAAVSRATGIAVNTIERGIRELELGEKTVLPADRIRKKGGGRKSLLEKHPKLPNHLERLMEPYTSGLPTKPLKWTSKSLSNLAEELRKQGYKISANTVGSLLKDAGYSLQSNRKRFEGNQHPDRNEQFEYITNMTEAFQSRGCPVISVDTKKKELIGNYKNQGSEWTPKGCATEVKAYDFIDQDLGKAIPYGVYDTTYNKGFVSVGVDHDTAKFAVSSIERWWSEMGEWYYPESREILILADGGGSNGSRSRLWKKSLQDWADREDLIITVCHFPPGTSKWNKIEHRMFSFISKNWRGKPLVSHEVIIQLIGSTTTKKGLQIKAELDINQYPTGIKVSDEEFDCIKIERADFHGEWNYSISPKVD